VAQQRRATAKKHQGSTKKKKTPAKPQDWSAAVRRAEAEARRNAASIEAGETFASQKRTGREGAPSKYGGGRNS
jgi:hypothetical protein